MTATEAEALVRAWLASPTGGMHQADKDGCSLNALMRGLGALDGPQVRELCLALGVPLGQDRPQQSDMDRRYRLFLWAQRERAMRRAGETGEGKGGEGR